MGRAALVRAVIFDLWDTLVEWPVAEGERLVEQLSRYARVPAAVLEGRLRDHYRALQTGPLAEGYRLLGVPESELDAALEVHHDVARRTLRLRRGGAAALVELRRRGLKLGLITVCSEDVPRRFPETDLAGLFDAATFSSECGLMKPEPEIYLMTARALGVRPEECLFVGDGANDELDGARRVGMEPVLFLPAGQTPRWPGLQRWEGLRVSALEEVAYLC